MLSLAHEILPTLGYRIDAIADPVEELKSVILAASGFTGIDERFANLMCDRFDNLSPILKHGLSKRPESLEALANWKRNKPPEDLSPIPPKAEKRFADMSIQEKTDSYNNNREGFFKRSMLKGLGYRTDSVESFDDAVRTLLAPYRTDAIADVRDLISAKATEQLGEHIQGFTKAIAAKVKSWKDEDLSPKQISDRIDNLYADLDGTELAEGLADWLAIAYLAGGEGAIN